jgi:hypothetical protein
MSVQCQIPSFPIPSRTDLNADASPFAQVSYTPLPIALSPPARHVRFNSALRLAIRLCFHHRTRLRSLLRPHPANNGELAARPEFRAEDPQCKHSRHANDRQAREDAVPGPDAQVDEHGTGELDAAGGEEGAEERVGGEQGGRVLWVGQREVDEDALEDYEVCRDDNYDADDGDDPVHAVAGCPACHAR